MIPTPDIIEKYNRPGPRYTSYPTALEFSETFDREALIADLRSQTGPLSLYFHLPFCQSLCWFCGCNTIIKKDRSHADAYLDYLDRELQIYDELRQPDRPVVQLHFGGGTPNFLQPAQIDRLAALIHARFSFATDAENSVELDPRDLSAEHVQAFARLGINRASFGVQDINPDVQRAINRVQPQDINQRAAGWIRDAGFQSLNIDLVYGLPLQTEDNMRRTLDAAIALQPDRFAVFNYAHVPWMKPAQKLLQRHPLPDAALKLRLFHLIIRTLTDAGYVYIGLDHFARPDDELVIAQRNGTLQRNFQGYSTRAGADILALGVSSISQTPNHYRQNVKALPEYQNSLDRAQLPLFKALTLTAEDKLRRTVIMRLMCDMALNFNKLSRLLEVNFAEHFAPEIEALDEFVRDGLLEKTAYGFRVTDPGRLLIRNIALTFDEHTPRQTSTPGNQRFSRTI